MPPEEGEGREIADRNAGDAGHDEVGAAGEGVGRLAKRRGDAAVGVMDRGDRGDADRDAQDRQQRRAPGAGARAR